MNDMSRYLAIASASKLARKPRVNAGPRRKPEADLQKAVIRALRTAFPRWYVHGSLMGVNLGPRKGAEAKAMGCMPGFPDVLLISPEGKVGFLELKTPEKNITESSLSFEQKEFRGHCEQQWGLRHAVVNAPHTAIETVRSWT